MRRLTMLVVLVAALVVASSTTGALLAQSTHKHSTTRPSTTQQGSTTTPPNTQQPSPSNDASGATSPQAADNCGFSSGDSLGYTIYGPTTYDPLYRNSTDVGANNHSLVYDYIVPQPPPQHLPDAVFLVCKYDPNTGKETDTGVLLATNFDGGYGKSYIDPPPSGNSYAIHDGLLPPLGPIDGPGIYAVYDWLDFGGANGPISNPHYFYVH